LIKTNGKNNQQSDPVTVPVILDESDGYCSGDFGSGYWLLFTLLWVRLLVIAPIIVDQAVGHRNSNQQPDPK
jgi:hypothetical protein